MHTDGHTGLSSLAGATRRRLKENEEDYGEKSDDERPLRGYAALLALYGGLVAGLAGIGRWRNAEIPERLSAGDLALCSLATHKLSRMLTKDPVTSPIRFGVTRYAGPSGDGEVMEEPRGTGFSHAAGELLTCPFCIGQWVATSFVAGLVLAPRPTRLVASVLAITAGSDVLQLVYARAQELTE